MGFLSLFIMLFSMMVDSLVVTFLCVALLSYHDNRKCWSDIVRDAKL